MVQLINKFLAAKIVSNILGMTFKSLKKEKKTDMTYLNQVSSHLA